ncbi:L-lactate MFS transporter [Vibrio marisflavi]|uniref:MFS-type transporter YhjX n=1 Tax=Vibrio marisflavi CECT 7928 TaxID=634439 RepID=A0ABM8ZYK0_9VIBR|nr:OFA family MFS transporter [Vibrio marisflavi]CAH0536024.1 putative MFS-type transporter YhjX [Vibrio marisflavi CECT 7928]
MNKRWLYALCAVGIHISIGSIYAWSQIAVAIKNQPNIHWGLGDITVTFSIAIFCLGIAAAFMGKIVETKGPKFTGLLSALLFGLGLIGSGVALKNDSLWLLYLTYGAIGGVGIGLGYITPVSTLLKWFPDKRGLAMGLTVMGFGFGAVIEIFVLRTILPALGITDISTQLMILGVIYFVLIFVSSRFLVAPSEEFIQSFKQQANHKKVQSDLESLNATEALKRPRFYGLWLLLFINVSCGIALISVAKFMGHDVINLSLAAAAFMVMIMSVFNGIGRFLWAFVSDYLGRPVVYTLFFIIQIFCFYVLTKTHNPVEFQLAVFAVLSCYGGGFSLVPAYIGDIFGTKQPGVIHGYILSAWAAAGLFAPTLIAYTKQFTGSYTGALYVFMAFLAIALVISVSMLRGIKKSRLTAMNLASSNA